MQTMNCRIFYPKREILVVCDYAHIINFQSMGKRLRHVVKPALIYRIRRKDH